MLRRENSGNPGHFCRHLVYFFLLLVCFAEQDLAAQVCISLFALPGFAVNHAGMGNRGPAVLVHDIGSQSIQNFHFLRTFIFGGINFFI
jgi:hypothetical protein